MPQFNRRRERTLNSSSGTITLGTLKRFHPNGTLLETTKITSTRKPYGTHEVTSDNLNIGPPYLSGGPFASIKVGVNHNDIQGFGTYTTRPALRNQDWYEYVGGFVPPNLADTSFVSAYNAAASDDPYKSGLLPSGMDSLGEEAYNKMKPKLEIGGIAVFLAESREIPSMLKQSAKGFHDVWRHMGGDTSSLIMQPKKVADHYLNTQFGWRPFISDLVKFNDVIQNSEAYIKRINAQNGLWIKKNVRLSGSSTSQTTTFTDPLTPGIGPWGFEWEGMCQPTLVGSQLSYGTLEKINYTQRWNWASGSFKYYRPEFDETDPGYSSGWNTLNRHLILHGARINPSVIWKATRWTWLVDWFSNAGALIDRGTAWANDAVVSRYMFLMSRSLTSKIYRSAPRFWNGPRKFEWQSSVESKLREENESPYGFRLGLPLTARQLSILGAIGISRKVPGNR